MGVLEGSLARWLGMLAMGSVAGCCSDVRVTCGTDVQITSEGLAEGDWSVELQTEEGTWNCAFPVPPGLVEFEDDGRRGFYWQECGDGAEIHLDIDSGAVVTATMSVPNATDPQGTEVRLNGQPIEAVQQDQAIDRSRPAGATCGVCEQTLVAIVL